MQKALSFAIKAAYRLLFENAFLQDALSITTESTAAFGVKGLEADNGVENWKSVCKQIVQQSLQKTRQKRHLDESIDFVSPHMSNWTACQAHGAFRQKRVFSHPTFQPNETEDELSESEQSQSMDGIVGLDVSHDIKRENVEDFSCKSADNTAVMSNCQSRNSSEQVGFLV